MFLGAGTSATTGELFASEARSVVNEAVEHFSTSPVLNALLVLTQSSQPF